MKRYVKMMFCFEILYYQYISFCVKNVNFKKFFFRGKNGYIYKMNSFCV